MGRVSGQVQRTPDAKKVRCGEGVRAGVSGRRFGSKDAHECRRRGEGEEGAEGRGRVRAHRVVEEARGGGEYRERTREGGGSREGSSCECVEGVYMYLHVRS